VFCVHFALIQLANMPMSPLKLSVFETVDRYVNPFFAQRWSFFAPQPIEHDSLLVARVRYRDPATGAPVISPWFDITSPLIDSIRKNRLTPLFLVEIGLSNAVLEFENNAALDPRSSFVKDGQKYLKSQVSPAVDPIDALTMSRTALASLAITLPGKSFEAIQLGLVHNQYPRFTERHTPKKPEKLPLTLLDWQPASPVESYSVTETSR
jgi:hypothetical protein